jgi:pimeloyl-ACP methyl ester carboxylesterase
VSAPQHLDVPGAVRRTRLDTARGPLAALDLAACDVPGGASRTIALLVPGFTGSKEDFRLLLEPLAAEGRRVVAIDQRGQFESPAGLSREAYDVAQLAVDVLAVVEALADGPVHLVGHSFGGLVARDAVLAHPARFRSLTLLCSGPAALPAPLATDLPLLIEALGTLELEQVWTAVRALDTARGRPLPPPEVDAFLRRRYLANDPVGLLRGAEQLLAEPDRVDELAAALEAAGLPALVVTGRDDDRWSPAEQAEMARQLGVEHIVVPDAAHSPALENPKRTAYVLHRFWARHD